MNDLPKFSVRFILVVLVTSYFLTGSAGAQVNIAGPMIVAGTVNYPATTISSGGNIVVTTGGAWVFNGNLTGADKGNGNSPRTAGRTEKITFDGTGTYINNDNFIIDGYAAVSNQLEPFILPVGTDGVPYFVTVPAGVSVAAAYFDGLGAIQTARVAGIKGTSIIYSPYIDMPSGLPAGSYTFSYPSGLNSQHYSALFGSGNTSSDGTSNGTSYGLLTRLNNFSSMAGSTTTILPAAGATQVYFSSSTGGEIIAGPNPFHDLLNVSGLQAGDRLLFFDLQGNKLTTETSSGTSQSIRTAGYSMGIYILRIEHTDGSSDSKKVMKE